MTLSLNKILDLIGEKHPPNVAAKILESEFDKEALPLANDILQTLNSICDGSHKMYWDEVCDYLKFKAKQQ